MFGENPAADLVRFTKAFLTNQYARLAPKAYVEFTEQTGRGSTQETPEQIADYYRTCFSDYFRLLKLSPDEIGGFLGGRRILEYGPGDLPAVALLMYAHGADKVYCVDRFPLLAWSENNCRVMENLLQRLPAHCAERAKRCFNRPGDPSSGLSVERIEYLVRPSGLSGLREQVSLVYSRAVLEHVDDLQASFTDMEQALVPGGLSIHKVDLRSHGLHRRNSLDFLTWPVLLWRLMYSQKGVPNRWRVDQYRRVLAMTSLMQLGLEKSDGVDHATIAEVRPNLAAPFRHLSDEDLSWLGFWLVLRKPE